MTPLELRTRIESALSSAAIVMGTYTHSNGQTSPALWVDEGRPQAGITVQGLEVVVYLNPRPTVVHTFKHSIVLREWLAFIKNWDMAAGATEAALKAISEGFTHIRNVRFVPATSETLEMASLSIPE